MKNVDAFSQMTLIDFAVHVVVRWAQNLEVGGLQASSLNAQVATCLVVTELPRNQC